MAYLYEDFISGTTTDNPLTNVATTLNSAILAAVPEVTGGDICVLVLDPEAAGTGPEIVHITAHTASATSATILRGQEGTTGVEHASGTKLIHSLTATVTSNLATAEASSGTLVFSGGKGAAVVTTSGEEFLFRAPFPFTLVSGTVTCGVASTGSAVICDAEINGTTVFSTLPQCSSGSKYGTKQAVSVTAVASGDRVGGMITSVGSTTPGENVTFILEITVP